MGVIEKENSERSRRANLQKIILQTVATAGVLGVALLAPNALRAIKQLGILPTKRQREYIRESRERLLRQGLLTYDDGSLRLTNKGEKMLDSFAAHNYQIHKPKRWDKKWRILIFDIPERRKSTREKIRRILSSIGFVRVQDSVWLYPYDCEDIVMLFKTDLRINKEMLYMIVDVLESDKIFRKHFSLEK